MHIKQIRLLVGKVKINATCIRCSKDTHTYNICSNKPFCKHDGLTHSPGDKQRCELYKSIKQCFQNILIMDNNNINPLSLSTWQIIDYLEQDGIPKHNIPKDLQISIPQSMQIPTNDQNPIDFDKDEDFKRNHNISKTDDELYDFEDNISSPSFNEQIPKTTATDKSPINNLTPLQTLTNIITNTKTNTNTNNRLPPNTKNTPTKPMIDLTSFNNDNDHQSQDDVDMIKPKKPKKPSPKADTSRSRSRTRKPRNPSSQTSKRNRNRK